MQKFYTLIFLFCSSCYAPHVSYIGNTGKPTTQVDVYVAEGSIKKAFEVVGKGYYYPVPFDSRPEETMQHVAVKKAKEVGADAVLIKDYVVVTPLTNSTIVVNDSSSNHRMSSVANTEQTITNKFTILFIKYVKN